MISVIIAFGLTIGLILLSKFTLISNIFIKVTSIFIASLLIASFILVLRLPNMKNLVDKGDSLGYKERFLTAFEILNDKDKNLNSFEKLVVEDAINKAKKADFKKEYIIYFPKEKVKIIGIMLIGTMIVGFAPSPLKEKLDYQIQLRENIEEEIKEIEKVQKETQDNKELTEEQVKKIKKELEELKKNLKKSKNEGDILRARQKTQQELKKISKDSVQRDLKKVGESLSQHEITRELGDQLQKGDLSEIKRSLDALNKELENMDEDQLNELANAFKEAALALEEDSQLRDSLMSYQEAITSGNLTELQGSYKQLSEQLDNLASQNKELREAIEQINRLMNEEAKKKLLKVRNNLTIKAKAKVKARERAKVRERVKVKVRAKVKDKDKEEAKVKVRAVVKDVQRSYRK